MKTQAKYKAKPLYYCPDTGKTYQNKPLSNSNLFFASTFEFLVYRELVDIVGIQNVKLQVPLKIKERTEVYSVLNWRCDFRIYIRPDQSRYINVEAKGMVTDEFKRVVQYLEYFSPKEYEQLMVIGNYPSAWINPEIRTWSFTDGIEFIKSLVEQS